MKEARLYNIGKTVSSTNGVGKTGQVHVKKKMKLDHSLTTYTEINLKWIKRPKCETGHYKTPRGNTGKEHSDINHGDIFFKTFPRIMDINPKINKWDLLKHKSFCTTKKTISNAKKDNPQIGRKYLQIVVVAVSSLVCD